jgi:hypothetical protein
MSTLRRVFWAATALVGAFGAIHAASGYLLDHPTDGLRYLRVVPLLLAFGFCISSVFRPPLAKGENGAGNPADVRRGS